VRIEPIHTVIPSKVEGSPLFAKCIFRRQTRRLQYHKKYPNYGFDRNIGYGSEEHILAIKKYGIAPIHRKSFLKNILINSNN